MIEVLRRTTFVRPCSPQVAPRPTACRGRQDDAVHQFRDAELTNWRFAIGDLIAEDEEDFAVEIYPTLAERTPG